jgi:predicted dehydrogenase
LSESTITRRELLGAAAGFAIPAIVPSHVIGRPGRPGANDRIVVANIGIGGMGRTHVGPDTAALCDVDQTRLADVAKSVMATGKRTISTPPDLVGDFRRILDRKDIDAITNGTPDHWHAHIAIMACQAGKHVYSEKPTARTLQEGRLMVEAARRYNRVVQIGAQGRSHPAARAACQYVRAGMLGRVDRVDIYHPDNPTTTETPGNIPVPSSLDWEMWLGPAKWRAYHPAYHPARFRWFMDLGGGQIRDRGNHAMSLVCWLMNHDRYRGLVTVESHGRPQTTGMYDVPLQLAISWKFHRPDWTLTWTQGPVPKTHGLWGATYHGDKDSLIVIQGDNACSTEEKAIRFVPPPGREVYLHQTDPALSATERNRQNWLDCIRTGKRPVMDVEIGYRTVTYCILGNLSYLLGRALTYDTGKERFVNDPEADRLIAAPYRAPWEIPTGSQ